MSTITVLASGDQISASRAVINTNFSNLNTDKEEVTNKSTDTSLGTSDTLYPTQNAVKAYVDAVGNISTGLKQALVAGATINGATTPVPVYQNKTDNEVYACDGNDLATLKFMGFAVTNGTNGTAIDVVTTGLVTGFTGLAEGEKYYLQDAVGTIGTTVGTYEVLVGIAISETELVITKGRRHASGTTTFTTTTTTAITLGFRPSAVRVSAVNTDGAGKNSMSWGAWTVFGGNDCVYIGHNDAGTPIAGSNATAWYVISDAASAHHTGNVTTITDTGFTLDNTEGVDGTTVSIIWEADGDQ